MSINCVCLFLSTVSQLDESYKQGDNSTLSSRYEQVGNAFLQEIDVL